MVGWWGRFLFAGLLAGKGFSAADVSTYNATCVDETTTLLQTTVPRHQREVCGTLVSADTAGNAWDVPRAVTSTSITGHPSCRSYIISGIPDELVGGTYMGGPCWPGGGQTWTIHFSIVPTTLYVYASDSHSSISSGLLADDWQVVTAPSFENFEYSAHPGKRSHIWSKRITSGTSYAISLTGTLVGGVFAAPTCSPEATCPDGSAAAGNLCVKVFETVNLDVCAGKAGECEPVWNYCSDGFHLGTKEEYEEWFNAGNTGPQGGFGETSTTDGNNHWVTRNEKDTHYGWMGPQSCCSPERFFLCVGPKGSFALASAVGDPHLVNLRGEKFDLNVAGEHLLLQIPQGSGEELEVVGFVEHMPIQKSGQSPCEQFLFKNFTVRGNYVDAHKGEIVIDAGQNLTLQGFTTSHQQHGTTTSTTYDSLLNRNAPTTVGKVQMWGCTDNSSKRQRSLCKQLGSMKGAGHRQLTVFTRKASMFVMELQGAGSLPMHLAFSRFEGASPSYLNLALHGFSPSNPVGGLLGSDDHSEVSKIKATCITTHHSKERPAARRHAEAHRNAAQTR